MGSINRVTAVHCITWVDILPKKLTFPHFCDNVLFKNSLYFLIFSTIFKAYFGEVSQKWVDNF